ncbi:peptidoglycan endopeptidase [Neobacillus mesonae]|nr:peptidoglycan endopeptidase [Neobacillus mesonae]
MKVTVRIRSRSFDGYTDKVIKNQELIFEDKKPYMGFYDMLKILGYNDIESNSRRYRGTDGSLWVTLPKSGTIGRKGLVSMRMDPMYYEGSKSFISLRTFNRLFNVDIRYIKARKTVIVRQPALYFITMRGDTLQSVARALNTTVSQLRLANKRYCLRNPLPANVKLRIPGAHPVRNKPTKAKAYINLTPTKANAIISLGRRFLGTPYEFGAAPYPQSGTFDCSSFQKYIFGRNGIFLPRTSSQQSRRGTAITRSQIRRGDLVFFTSPRYSDRRVGHVGLHIGSGDMINTFAPPGVNIRDWQNRAYWQNSYVKARRISG